MSCNLNAQEITKHRWNDRVIILLGNQSTEALVEKQLMELLKTPDDLTERKLKVYVSVAKRYENLDIDVIELNPDLVQKYNPKNKDFKFILIGLDGGVKMGRSAFVPTKELFGLIDGMPMRRNEIRNNR